MRVYLLLLLINVQIYSVSQNLVKDSGFEIKNKASDCPNRTATNDGIYLKHWKGINTIDYYHRCSPAHSAGVPKNPIGLQEAFEGDAYVGMIVCSNKHSSYREYLQTELTEALKAGKTYHIEIHISHAENSGYAINNLGFYFSNEVPTLLKRNYNHIVPQVNIAKAEVLKDHISWTKITGKFKAKGGETFLTIGCFLPTEKIKFQTVKRFSNTNSNFMAKPEKLETFAYYYLDAVKVYEENPIYFSH